MVTRQVQHTLAEKLVKVGFEGFFDVAGHGEVDSAGNVVPFERQYIDAVQSVVML